MWTGPVAKESTRRLLTSHEEVMLTITRERKGVTRTGGGGGVIVATSTPTASGMAWLLACTITVAGVTVTSPTPCRA